MTLGIPYSFVPGSKAKAEEVNANFVALKNNIEDLDSNKVNRDFSNLTNSEIDNIKETIGVNYKNIGEIVYSTIPIQDAGLHLLDGTLIGSGAYADFVEYIKYIYEDEIAPNIFCSEEAWQSSVTTYGECGKFVYNSENETVRLPKINGLLEGTTEISKIGNLTKAGLPAITHTHTRGSMNITGSARLTGVEGVSASGAFSAGSTASGYNIGHGNGTKTNQFTFNASNNWSGSTSNNTSVNSIYGSSSTVQPQTIKCFVYIVIANSTQTELQSNIDEILTDLNTKADTDGTNMSESVKHFDGAWVNYSAKIASGISLSSNTWYTYDLSSYLPKDSYNYEVLIRIFGSTGSTSGNAAQIYAKTDLLTGDYTFCVARTTTRASGSVPWGNTQLMPVGTGRKLMLRNTASTAATGVEIDIEGYRRIGTNK